MKNLNDLQKNLNKTQIIDQRASVAIKGGGGSEPPPFGVEA